MPYAISFLAVRRESGKAVSEDVPSELVQDDCSTSHKYLIVHAALRFIAHKKFSSHFP